MIEGENKISQSKSVQRKEQTFFVLFDVLGLCLWKTQPPAGKKIQKKKTNKKKGLFFSLD